MMAADTWTIVEAKARLSEMIDEACTRGPQTITRHGRKAVVVVAADEWERKTRRVGTLAEFFAASPLRGSGLKIKRRKDRPRKLDL
jgi:prevent-host-death family protein